MIFIRESSRGSIAFRLVQFGMSRGGLQITVGMVDQQGCAKEGEGWNSLYAKSSLGDLIAARLLGEVERALALVLGLHAPE